MLNPWSIAILNGLYHPHISMAFPSRISTNEVEEVVETAVSLSLGEAIVATANGDVVAAKDMARPRF